MFSNLTRCEFVLAILAIATISTGAVFAAEDVHESHEFSGGAFTNLGAGQTVFTTRGPIVTTGDTHSYQTSTLPGGGAGILMNNGNGTNTLTGPSGFVATVPSRR